MTCADARPERKAIARATSETERMRIVRMRVPWWRNAPDARAECSGAHSMLAASRIVAGSFDATFAWIAHVPSGTFTRPLRARRAPGRPAHGVPEARARRLPAPRPASRRDGRADGRVAVRGALPDRVLRD